MFAVCATLEIDHDSMADFMPLMVRNAQTSLRDEKGCQQFDVLTDHTKPNSVFLYELYTDRAAFDAHLSSAHFKVFDAATAPMIVAKDVQTWDQVTQ